MEKARVTDVGRLTDSVIGREAEVSGGGVASMLLGDHSIVELDTRGSPSG